MQPINSKTWRPLAVILLAFAQPACIIVGGYSSDRGFYIWPGTIISIAIVVIVLLLLRRRRLR